MPGLACGLGLIGLARDVDSGTPEVARLLRANRRSAADRGERAPRIQRMGPARIVRKLRRFDGSLHASPRRA
jgi:hypothetical protein